MTELDSQLKKGNGVEEQLKNLTDHVRKLRKENSELRNKVEKIENAIDSGAITEEEKEDLKLKNDIGGPANENIAEILKKAKTGNGVPAGEVENILDCSRRHALKMMRKLSDEFDGSFRRGSGNKPSMLKKKTEFNS